MWVTSSLKGRISTGRGVNIAARLEALAQPESIAISGQVRDQIAGKLSISLNDLGEALKNIERPVRVFEVELNAPAVVSSLTSARDRVSIAILPFVNMTGDAESEAFGDGLAEDIITALSYSAHFW